MKRYSQCGGDSLSVKFCPKTARKTVYLVQIAQANGAYVHKFHQWRVLQRLVEFMVELMYHLTIYEPGASPTRNRGCRNWIYYRDRYLNR